MVVLTGFMARRPWVRIPPPHPALHSRDPENRGKPTPGPTLRCRGEQAAEKGITMATKKDVSKTTPKGVGAPDYGEYSGRGYGGTDRDDFMIPFLNLLQSNSPQVKKSHQEYVEGAEESMFLHSVTGELFDGRKGVLIQPCCTEHRFTEWLPRSQGGGFRGSYPPDHKVVQEARAKAGDSMRLQHENGNDLVDSYYMYVNLLASVDAEEPEGPCVLAFTSTKIKHYRRAMTRARTIKGGDKIPLFAHRLLMKSWQDHNQHGDFQNVEFFFAVEDDVQKSLLKPDHPLLKFGAQLEEQITSGSARADFEKQSGGGGEATDDVF